MNPETLAIAEELAALENGTIEPKDFPHSEHVRFGYEMLGLYPFGDTVARFSRGLRHLAQKSGRSQLYHETITVAFLALIAERKAAGHYSGWSEFKAGNEDLFDKNRLRSWYSAAQLQSDLARKVFCLPAPRELEAVSTQGAAPRAHLSAALFAYTLGFSAYITWSSLNTAPSAHEHNPAVLLLALTEIAGSLLFAFRSTRTAGLLLLLVVFMIAFTLSVALGESSVRFVFYAATALFLWQLPRLQKDHLLSSPKSYRLECLSSADSRRSG